jgi:Terminase small subunit
VRKLIFE